MASREFAEWLAFYSIEPFGEARADLRTAMLMALLANIYRDEKKQPRPFEAKDFMPQFDRAPDEHAGEAWRVQKAQFQMLVNLTRPKAKKKRNDPGDAGR